MKESEDSVSKIRIVGVINMSKNESLLVAAVGAVCVTVVVVLGVQVPKIIKAIKN